MRKYLIKLLEHRITQVKSDLIIVLGKININPVQEYIDLRNETKERISKFPDNLSAMRDPEFSKFISNAAKIEKKLMAEMKDTGSDQRAWDDRLELEQELSELQTALWQEERRD